MSVQAQVVDLLRDLERLLQARDRRIQHLLVRQRLHRLHRIGVRDRRILRDDERPVVQQAEVAQQRALGELRERDRPRREVGSLAVLDPNPALQDRFQTVVNARERIVRVVVGVLGDRRVRVLGRVVEGHTGLRRQDPGAVVFVRRRELVGDGREGQARVCRALPQIPYLSPRTHEQPLHVVGLLEHPLALGVVQVGHRQLLAPRGRDPARRDDGETLPEPMHPHIPDVADQNTTSMLPVIVRKLG